jgi:3-phenylpropionate/trans-cinnamate dioxygenase ferredoxin component
MSGTEDFLSVAQADDVPEGTLLPVTAPDGTALCLYQLDGRIGACADECTHQAFPMSEGELIGDGQIECICHGARFDLATGAVTRGPAEEPLPVYEVRVEGGQVLVATRAGAGRSDV